MNKPNIIFINTDQQRFDTIGALNAPFMETPNLDKLVKEGVAFNNCFTSAPSCVPARASIFNGYYPHNTGVLCNGDTWEPSWVERLGEEGYHCVNIGKMHMVPLDAKGGFHQRFIVENKDRALNLDTRAYAFYDEWDKYLAHEGVEKPSREKYKTFEDYGEALGAFEWYLDSKYHADNFVGNMACWWLKNRKSDSPLFLEIGFPGPHPPFDPVKEYIELYMNKDLPLPDEVTEEELKNQTLHHHLLREEMINPTSPRCKQRNNSNHSALKWQKNPSPKQLKRMRAYYYANITMIDEKIGKIIEVLENKGYLDNSIIIFTSDHGEHLGDHGLIQKYTMYDCVVKVPLIIWCPKRFRGGRKINSLTQSMDIAPTILELAGIDVPGSFDARSLIPLLNGEKENIREYVFAEHGKDTANYCIKCTDLMTMIRSKKWKLVHYLKDGEQECGELYNLNNDPGEKKNLWKNNNYQDVKQKFLLLMNDWRLKSIYRARPTIMEGKVESSKGN